MARRRKSQLGCFGMILMFMVCFSLCVWLLSISVGIFIIVVISYFSICVFTALAKPVFNRLRPILQWTLEFFRMKDGSEISDVKTDNPSTYCEIRPTELSHTDLVPEEPIRTYSAEKSQQNDDLNGTVQNNYAKNPKKEKEYKLSIYDIERFARECNAYLEKQDRKEAEKNNE